MKKIIRNGFKIKSFNEIEFMNKIENQIKQQKN